MEKHLRLGRFLPAGAWYALIWWFSSKSAAVSGGQSGALLRRLLEAVSDVFRGSEMEIQTAASELLSFPIRKCAHMFLYFVLALLLLHALVRLSDRGWRLALPLCALLSAVDEYHQTFVPGRSGELRDVLVDLGGAAAALLLFALLRLARRRPLPPSLALLAVPAVLAVSLAGAGWAPSSLQTLAERSVPGFSALDGPGQAQLLGALAPVLRDAVLAAVWCLWGLCAWVAGRLAGLRARPVLGLAAGSAVLAALTAALAGTSSPALAAGLLGAGWALTASLWTAAGLLTLPRSEAGEA